MGAGGGIEWNPLEDVKKIADDPVGTIVSAMVNSATLGTVGFENGKFTPGVITRTVDEVAGNITGRNIARKQAMEMKDMIAEQARAAEKERAGRLQQQEQTERQASIRSASSSRRSGTGSNGGIGGSGIEQQMAIDFLGL